jgi:hypothetical protein
MEAEKSILKRLREQAFPILIGLSVSVQGACGSSNGEPSGPPPLRITPAIDVILVGEVVQLTASQSDSSSAIAATNAIWSTSPLTIATVDATGRLIGLANGQAVVTANVANQSATIPVRVATRFAGEWVGNYTITGCSRDGSFEIVNLCSALLGTVNPLSWSAIQNKLAVSNGFSVGSSHVAGTAQGIVADAGTLSWSGSRVEPTAIGDVAVSMSSTDSIVVNATFVGTVTEQWTLAGSPGSARLTGTFTMNPAITAAQIHVPTSRTSAR